MKDKSFSSTLLDEINRSIAKERGEDDLSFYRHTHSTSTSTRKPQQRHGNGKILEKQEKMPSGVRRASFIEKWMENKVNDHQEPVIPFSNTSTSSDSSFGGFSSSEAESYSSLKARASCFAPPRPKQIRTTVKSAAEDRNLKSRSTAMKIYSNLKGLKQPVSPGIRLTTFINSLFVKEGSKKKRDPPSTCSSATSFSRSCLMSRRNANAAESDNGIKRSVRFYPVSVIVDEDSRPCGEKSLRKDDQSPIAGRKLARALSKRYEELKKQREIEEMALELLNGYGRARNIVPKVIKGEFDGDSDNDDIDGLSCSSSDLFELDHLSLIGDDELPVYETTHNHFG